MVMTNMTRTNRTLVIMAKALDLGSVKTRLTKTLPVQAVARAIPMLSERHDSAGANNRSRGDRDYVP